MPALSAIGRILCGIMRHGRRGRPSLNDRAVEDPADISQTDELPGCSESAEPTSVVEPSAARLALYQDC